MIPLLVIVIPFTAAAVLAAVPSGRIGAWMNCAASALTFALACALPWRVGIAGPLLLVDALAAHVALLTAFVAMTTAWFSVGYVGVELAAGRLDRRRLRLYHALFQCLAGGMLLALLSNDLAVTWIALEIATIAAALAVGLPRTAAAVRAASKCLIVCGVGLGLALFGTVALHLAAWPATGADMAMRWSGLHAAAPRCDRTLLDLAFVFMLLGYGCVAALVLLHAWMPDAQAEGPAPLSAVLAASVLNVALVVILRLRTIMAAHGGGLAPGPPIMALGLLSLLLAAFSLWRQRDVRRFFALSTVAQSGVVAFAFGLGGPAAVFAGLLQMTLHTLAKASLVQCAGHAAQLKGGQRFADIAGLLVTHRMLGLSLAAAIVAVAALPPFGLFASAFLIATETMRRAPLLSIPLGVGLVACAWALVMRLHALCLGPPTPDRGPAPGVLALVPVWVQLAIVLTLGLAMPQAVTDWLASAAR